MSYQLTGKIKEIRNVRQVSEKFRVREFVVTDASTQYPQDILIQLSNDKCETVDAYSVGSEVTVSFNLRGRAWTKEGESEVKYFNTIEGWRIEGVASATPQAQAPQAQSAPVQNPQAQAQAQAQAYTQPQASTVVSSSDDSDLPF